MNRLGIILCLIFFTNFLFSQTDIHLPGVVVEQNSKFKTGKILYLPNVSIKASGAIPTLSDLEGSFDLLFTDKPLGNSTRLYVAKNGFEIVNDREIESAAVIGRKKPLKIVLCKTGQLYENQIAYYKIFKETVLKEHQNSLDILEKEGYASTRLIKKLKVEYNKKILSLKSAKRLLEDNLEIALQRAQTLSEQFTVINLDDQNTVYQRAFENFLSGNIDDALKILDSVNLEERLKINTKEEKKENELIQELSESVLKRNEQKRQDIEQCIFKARLHSLNSDFLLAKKMYLVALKYDKENMVLRYEYSKLIANQNDFKEAKESYEIIVKEYSNLAVKSNKNDYYPLLALTHNALGLLFKDSKNYTKSKENFKKALEISMFLFQEKPSIYLERIAINLGNLGMIESLLKDIKSAKKYYYESLEKYRLLRENNNIYDSDGYAHVLSNLGLDLHDEGEEELAKEYLKKAEKIFKENVKSETVEDIYNLAGCYLNLGFLYSTSENSDIATKYFENSIQLFERLVSLNPERFKPRLAFACLEYGKFLFFYSKKIKESKKTFERTIGLYNELDLVNKSIYSEEMYWSYFYLANSLEYSDYKLARETYHLAIDVCSNFKVRTEDKLFLQAQIYERLSFISGGIEDIERINYSEKALDLYLQLITYQLPYGSRNSYLSRVFNVAIDLANFYHQGQIFENNGGEKSDLDFKKASERLKKRIYNNQNVVEELIPDKQNKELLTLLNEIEKF
ncbi:tetratricopeptide repeat protein [Zobellia uliginosa]|uniref:tetratricopeptide repeat protein n=1 Tax=Zobellia uliginosa TaxID=143224 RepID=UPI001C07385F|nr:tetratricopeptide repeat protein [Zobellia uliginosa]MBU2946601.1 tetratricopeptide repeat protein [Zobellia uliginosa]